MTKNKFRERIYMDEREEGRKERKKERRKERRKEGGEKEGKEEGGMGSLQILGLLTISIIPVSTSLELPNFQRGNQILCNAYYALSYRLF